MILEYLNENFPYFLPIAFFILGALVGSFLNVVIYRIPLGLNIVSGRSFCPNCKTKLSPLDLFPLFSYVFLGGECRYCKVNISFRYFFVEFLTAIMFFAIYIVYGFTISTLIHIMMVCVLISVAFIDYDHHIIPDSLLIIAFSLNLYLGIKVKEYNIQIIMITALLVALPYILTNLIAKCRSIKGFGLGDIKLALVLGLAIPYNKIFLFMGLTLCVLFVKIISHYLVEPAKKEKIFGFAPFLSLAYFIFIIFFSQGIRAA